MHLCVGGRTLSSPGKIADFIESFTFFTKTTFNFYFESQIDGIPVVNRAVTFHLDAGQLGLVDSRLSLPSTAAPTLILRSLH